MTTSTSTVDIGLHTTAAALTLRSPSCHFPPLLSPCPPLFSNSHLSSLHHPSPALLHLRLLPPILSHVQVIVLWGGKESMPQRLKLPPLPVPLLSVHQPHSKVGANSKTVTCVTGTSSVELTLWHLYSCML